MMRAMLRSALASLLVLAATPFAAAQTGFAPKPGEEIDRADRGELRRTVNYLAYTLGELHYLAFACVSTEDQQWRERMIELLELEALGDSRGRAALIEAFNEGYAVQQRYRTRCGFESDAERRALAHRGRDLAEMMRAAYFD